MKLSQIALTPPIVAIIVSFGLMLSASATSWFVATDGNDTDNAGSETSPFATLAKAYAAAADTGDDEIVIKPGTYVMSAGLVVEKPVTFRSSTGIAEDVKIDGNKKVRPFVLNNAEAKLLGICVQNGVSESPNSSPAGNVWIKDNGGTVESCIIRGGTHKIYAGVKTVSGGGGIFCQGAKGLVLNCVITNNTLNAEDGSYGGGINLKAGAAVGCFIAYNKGTDSAKITSWGIGAAVRGTGKLVNCTIAHNPGVNCGGVYAYDGTAKVVNCVLWDNAGDGANPDAGGHTEVFEKCVSRYPINNTCICVDSLPAEGVFLAPTVASPCLDASIDVEGVTLPATDIFGNPRVIGAAADLGCVERQPATSPEADIRISQAVGIAPFTSTLTTHTENLTGITSYNWDFDGDGTVDETTTDPDVTHEYKDCTYQAVPTVSIVHSGGIFDCIASSAVSVMPRTMYVNSKCTAPAAPYDEKAKAASRLADALAIAIEGQEIVMLAEGSPYAMKTAATAVALQRAVTVRGETDNPEDVVITGGGTRTFRIGNPAALLHSVTIESASLCCLGTAVLVDTAGGVISNCIVRGCGVESYHSSGVVYARGADSLVSHCVITNNKTTSSSEGRAKGIGLAVESNAKAVSCLIAKNFDKTTKTTYTCAGGAYVNGGYLYNCTIVDNEGTYCGGVRTANSSADHVINCVIAGNTSLKKGDGYHNFETGYEAVYLNCASDDASPINSTCQADSAANLFKNYAIGDYTAASGDSKLVDRGADYEGIEATDILGAKRVMGKAIDIGAYEYDNETARLEGGLAADKDKGIVPQIVTFTATVGGTNGTDAIQFRWDFDGDGIYDQTTMDPVCPHLYAAGGIYTVKLLIEDLTSGQSCTVEKPNLLSFVGSRMFVTSDFNPGAEYPYDTVAKATSNLTTAVNAAQDGVEIIVLRGEHRIRARTMISTKVTLHGETGDPEDVVMRNAAKDAEDALMVLNNAGALVYGVTWENDAKSTPRVGWAIEGLGGTLSNCVVRGFRNGTYHATIGALTVSSPYGLATHCVITNNVQNGACGNDSETKAIVNVREGRLENSLIAYNRIEDYTKGQDFFPDSPLVRAAGAMVNCTIVSNEINSTSILFRDWRLQSRPGASSLTVPGGITNCIVACNTQAGEPCALMSLKSTESRGNIVDGDVDAPGWYRAADASEIFDAESAVSPWAISLAAAHKFPGARRATADTTDLAGNPRYTGKRLDPGCYQCPKSFGLMLKVK